MGGSTLGTIWFFFMAVFFYLAYAHFRNSRTSLRSFRLRQPYGKDEEDPSPEATHAIEEFVHDFNKYLDLLSENMRNQNLITAGAYFLAGFAALVSWVMGFIQ
jgi:hypothetical protein